MIVYVTQAMLTRLGYWVQAAGNGKDAIRTITGSENGIDLVILDLVMSGRDGGHGSDGIRREFGRISRSLFRIFVICYW